MIKTMLLKRLSAKPYPVKIARLFHFMGHDFVVHRPVPEIHGGARFGWFVSEYISGTSILKDKVHGVYCKTIDEAVTVARERLEYVGQTRLDAAINKQPVINPPLDS